VVTSTSHHTTPVDLLVTYNQSRWQDQVSIHLARDGKEGRDEREEKERKER
jgi:hypothetical protein